MSDLSNINVFDQIQSFCRDYRRQLRKGSQEPIEDYLNRIDESARENLFQNLLHIDIEYRRRQQKNPSSDEYVSRFPSYSGLVRQAFFESTMMSMAEVETPAEQETILFDMPPARRIGEYELLKELGRGGFGVVYKARNLQRQDHVALKTLPMNSDGQAHPLNDAERLHKFRREFRSLSEINHPNLIGMQTLEVDGNQWFFTMDLVDGIDLLDYVRPLGTLNESRLRNVLEQLVTGIIALHQQGIVHRDLKPNNVLVDAAGHVTILDFGLVAELQQNSQQTVSMKSRQFAGTPRYAAPEQMYGTRLPASDWYALGVLLYEALTGTVPFKGGHVEVMFKKQSEAAPILVGTPDLPADLTALVDQLLQRDPDLRPSVQEIQNVLGIANDSKSQDSTDSSLAFTPSQSAHFLIGRESQLAALEQSYSRLQETGELTIAMISGLSGEGKTSLADKFLEPLRLRDDVLVLAGRCYDRESVPFKAIDTLIDALVGYLRSRSSDEVHSWLPDDIAMLAQLFPVLRRVEAVADRSTHDIQGIDSRQIRYRAFNTLRDLLTTMSQTTPIVLFIDDLQWGDADSAAALFEVLSPPDSPMVMLLGSFRSDEAKESPFLKEWKQKNPSGSAQLRETLVEVAPLTEDQCLQLIATRLGVDQKQLQEKVENLYQETHGNPYFLEQLIEGFDAQTGKFQAVPLEEIIERKLQRLPAEAAGLLDVIAIAGQAAPIEDIATVAQDAGVAFSTLTHMRSERLIRMIGSSSLQQADTYHDKIRETVLAKMPEIKRQDLHIRYGEYLEEVEKLSADQIFASLDHDLVMEECNLTTSDRIFDLAYHFHAAEDDRAFAYQLMAGELSYRAYASEDAVEFLNRAEKLSRQVSKQVRFRLLERLASSHARLTQFSTAVQRYEQALLEAPSQFATASVIIGKAQCFQSGTQYDQAQKKFDQSLELLGASRPSNLMAILAIPWMCINIFAIPWKWQEARSKERAIAIELQRTAYSYLSMSLFDSKLPPIHYIYAIIKQASLGIRTGRPDSMAFSVALLAGHVGQAGLPAVGKLLVKKCRESAEMGGNREAKGAYLLGAATANANSHQLSLADQQFSEALPLLESAGSHMNASITAHLHRHIHAVMGTSTSERELGRKVLSLGEQAGEPRGQFWGHYDIASASARAGEIQHAKNEIELARESIGDRLMHLSQAIFLATHGYVLLQASEYQAARQVLEESWRFTKRRLLFLDYMVHAIPWLCEAIAGPNWIDESENVDANRLKQVLLLNWALFRFYPNLQSPIQRARGRGFSTLGRKKKAIRCFEKAVKLASDLGANYDKARSLLDLAAVKEEDREENRREAIELLKKMESVIPRAESWLLRDQYDEAVVAPEFDLTAWEQEHGAIRPQEQEPNGDHAS